MLLNDPPVNAPAMARPHAAPSTTTLVLVALAFLAPFLFYFPTATSFVDIWNSSETFAHGYIILPISLWLIWRRRANFSALPPTPWWPALGLLLLVGAGWMLARMGDVQVVMQYAFAAMFPVIALAVLGRRLAWSLAFPLLFLLFAVPFGEIFIQPLIEYTADFTVWAVQATGIPVLRNGTRFELPTGSWSVVEACSGVRYLISSVTIGCLYAYLTYRSLTKRLVFIAMSIIVPIVANWLRAYMIVMIGHTSDMALATGVDHLIYGWVFFGIVMFAMFWVGSYWREDTDVESESLAAGPVGIVPPLSQVRNMTLAVFAACALWPAFVKYNDMATHNPKPVQLATVPVSWAPAPAFTTWTPDFMKPDARYSGAFAQPGQTPVALNILYYRNQHRDKAVISSVNRLAGEDNAYHEQGGALRTEQIGGRSVALREARMQGPSGTFLVWHWSWIDGQPVVNNYVGKLRQAKAKLLFGGDDGAAVMLAAPYGESQDEARNAMRAFLESNLKALEASLERTRSN
ncbi:exosortase A [Massilia sp. PAMC28688]|uniref:exosortase A n=1 Tax=Massilia sp. PAMC28688 TaxID=2861283 RepID=UPI001C633389|nr:exosortase A [Massilia sp. PAMC28688]QYF95060.1 exosortase A [Massilia sp. PAMC28688]